MHGVDAQAGAMSEQELLRSLVEAEQEVPKPGFAFGEHLFKRLMARRDLAGDSRRRRQKRGRARSRRLQPDRPPCR